MFKDMSRVYLGDCVEVSKELSERYGSFIDCVITSPPYAQQRKNQYGGINEADYPQFTLDWLNGIEPLLKENANIFINIRPHIKNGEISDYVLKTRLLLRENGWVECEEIIWYKPDSPPLGSVNRPRRAYEHILWFSRTNKPYCNPKAVGQESSRLGFESNKFEHGGKSHIHAGQSKSKSGISRGTDVIIAGTSKVEKGIKHPAMFPKEIPDYLIKLGCPENGFIFDPFSGSGTTIRAAIDNNVGFLGTELDKAYYYESERYIKTYILNEGKDKIYEDYMEISETDDKLDL